MSRELKIMQCKWLRHHCNHFQSNASMIQCLPLATITTMPKINAVPTFQMTFWSNTLLSSLKQNQWLRHKFLLRNHADGVGHQAVDLVRIGQALK